MELIIPTTMCGITIIIMEMTHMFTLILIPTVSFSQRIVSAIKAIITTQANMNGLIKVACTISLVVSNGITTGTITITITSFLSIIANGHMISILS